MKKTLLTLCILILGLGLSFAQTLQLPNDWQEITTNAYESRYQDIPNDKKEAKLTKLQDKIDTYLNDILDANLTVLLSFIEGLAQEDLALLEDIQDNDNHDEDDNADQDQEDDNESIILEGFNPSTYQGEDKFFLGGTERQILGNFEITASKEPITIQTIQLAANKNIGSHIETWYIVNEDGEILAQKGGLGAGDTITFRSIDYFISQNQSENLYVVADLLPIGYNNYTDEGITFSYDFKITEAEGYYSGNEINQSTIASDEITIAPMQMFINKRSSAYGYEVDETLTSGENVVLIFEITAEGGDNQQTTIPTDTVMQLQKITVTVEDNTSGNNVVNNIMLQRIDTPSSEVTPNSVSGNEATFENFPSKLGEIDAGQTYTYMLTSDVTLGAQSGESLRVSLENLTEGGITRKEETGTTIYETNATQTYRIQGNRLTE